MDRGAVLEGHDDRDNKVDCERLVVVCCLRTLPCFSARSMVPLGSTIKPETVVLLSSQNRKPEQHHFMLNGESFVHRC